MIRISKSTILMFSTKHKKRAHPNKYENFLHVGAHKKKLKKIKSKPHQQKPFGIHCKRMKHSHSETTLQSHSRNFSDNAAPLCSLLYNISLTQKSIPHLPFISLLLLLLLLLAKAASMCLLWNNVRFSKTEKQTNKQQRKRSFIKTAPMRLLSNNIGFTL